MAQHNKEQHQSQASTKKSHNTSMAVSKTGKPMIVERFSKIPMVNKAIIMGYSQYDRLKSSNVTVGDVMSRAEGWAAFLWQKVQPIVEKLQEPINKADQLACKTLDYVENKLSHVSAPKAQSQS